MIIERLIIRNYRSIASGDLSLGAFNVLVGCNDQGKSNALRALNLFFNGTGDFGGRFAFEQEFCRYTRVPEKKPREIILELVFSPPASYSAKEKIHWKKCFRSRGLHSESIVMAQSGELPKRSRIRALLQNLKYYYVPAIKSPEYFSDLLGMLHDMLATTVEDKMRDASKSFTKSIREHTEGILKDIKEEFDLESSLQLPDDLRALFKTLDFQEKQAVNGQFMSLTRRGDGIKVRHIPILLKWFSIQANLNQAQGAIPTYSIWGYEEPENNLELSAASDQAKRFLEHSKTTQILITTHSPAFYKVAQDSGSVFSVKRVEGQPSVIEKITNSTDSLDIELGLLPFIAPYLERAEDERKRLLESLEELKGKKGPTLFVEGPSDQTILESAFAVLEFTNEDFTISGPDAGGQPSGVDWVKNSLFAAALLRKPDRVVGLVDHDAAGRTCSYEISKNPEVARRGGLVKCILLEKAPHIQAINIKGIDFPFDLEDLFPIDIRKYAAEQGWIEKRGAKELIPSIHLESLDESLKDFCLKKGLTEDELGYVFDKVKDDKKKQFSHYIKTLADKGEKQNFEPLRPLLERVKKCFASSAQ